MSAIGSAQTLSALALFTGPGQDFPGVAGQPLLTAQVAGNFPALERLPQITRDAAIGEANAAVAGLPDLTGGDTVAALRIRLPLCKERFSNRLSPVSSG